MTEVIGNRLIFTNSLWIIAEKGLRFCLGILVVGVVARHLGTELFGQLNFALAVLAIATVVATVGMNRIVPREVVGSISDKSLRSEIVSTVFFLRFSAALSILIFLYFFGIFFVGQNKTLFFLVVASLIFNPFDVIDLHQQGLARVKSVSVIRTLVFICTSLIKLIFVYIDANPLWFFAFVIFEQGLVALVLYLFICVKSGKGFLTFRMFNSRRAAVTLRESWPEIIAGLGGILFMRLDQVMLQFLQGSESVGVYSAAVRISEAWYFFPIAIVSATFPKIIQLREGSRDRYNDALLILFSALVGIAGVAVLFFLMFSDEIIAIVFGAGFSESVLILQVHCLVAVFIFIGSASGSWLAAERKLIWNLHRNLFGLIVNVILNLILIEKYGALGAAIATLISAVCAYYLFDLFSSKLRFMFRIKTQAIMTLGIYGAIRAQKYSYLLKS
ncbi:flippase [Marinobacter shengliensis]